MSWSFAKWYAANKEKHNAKRRERYANDPAYRERVRELNRRSRAKRRAIERGEFPEQLHAIKAIGLGYRETVDGKVGTGALARALGVTPQTVRAWEAKGIIAETPHRNEKGDRLYTPEQIEEAIRAVAERNQTGAPTGPAPITAKIVFADGSSESMALFRIGMLAKTVGRTVLTLEQLERQGVLPETPFRTAAGHRLYTVGMIEGVKKAFDGIGGQRLRGEERRTKFNATVREAWESLGVMGAHIDE